MLSQEHQDNIAQGVFVCMLSGATWTTLHSFYLCSDDPWLTDNVYEENKLYNAVYAMLGQHSKEIFSSQCCLHVSETTFH